jgi:xanthine/CO dehydrogenase XdhC/CoxF family maturation factor
MKELGEIAAAWRVAEQAGEEAILATVVEVQGSSYRRPGGRLLLTSAGRRRGAISGGCLEGDLAKKAWWLTAGGQSVVRTYDTAADSDGPADFGLGCNGLIHILIERLRPGHTALPVVSIEQSRATRQRAALATVIRNHDASLVGRHVAVLPGQANEAEQPGPFLGWERWLEDRAVAALKTGRSEVVRRNEDAGYIEAFVEAIEPPVHLLLFGGGDDAGAVVNQAKLLGWRVTVLDGRSSHARADRFPSADAVMVNSLDDPLKGVALDEWTIAVVMTHSFSQDAAAVGELAKHKLNYVGVLGPQRRTERLIETAGIPGGTPPAEWHSPAGLDLGGDTPEQVALAIIAEAHGVMEGRTPRNLRDRSGPIHATEEARTERPFVHSIVCA